MTKNNPGPFNCYERAEPDEPMFVLLGRDPCASFVVEFWAMLRTLSEENGLVERRRVSRVAGSWDPGAGQEHHRGGVRAVKHYLCLRCGAEEFDELLTSAPPRHPKCMGTVIGFDDPMYRAHVAHAVFRLNEERDVWNAAYAAAYVAEAASYGDLGYQLDAQRENVRSTAKHVADVTLECWRKDRPA